MWCVQRFSTHARPEPFDCTLILSLSKDERAAQDRLVEGRAARRSWFDKYILSELALRRAQGERVEGLTMSVTTTPLIPTAIVTQTALILSLSKDAGSAGSAVNVVFLDRLSAALLG